MDLLRLINFTPYYCDFKKDDCLYNAKRLIFFCFINPNLYVELL
ncbi:hypothetical protein SAMN04488009_1646 [Maribacter sedimenticola]|uniref:Uncharacterized protein n=1 Tax=Maribacter sedimenticola TaxID=228956 RepID=A0ABY1SGD9_9FLAO|nr:hypothetical protein SAMN04488009_1646 [Maribacter sedimenticola]